MKAPRVGTTHVASPHSGLRRECAARTWSSVIDDARDIHADSSIEGDAARRPAVRAAHANESFVNPLDEVCWEEVISRFIKLLAPKSDTIRGAASTARRAWTHGTVHQDLPMLRDEIILPNVARGE